MAGAAVAQRMAGDAIHGGRHPGTSRYAVVEGDGVQGLIVRRGHSHVRVRGARNAEAWSRPRRAGDDGCRVRGKSARPIQVAARRGPRAM